MDKQITEMDLEIGKFMELTGRYLFHLDWGLLMPAVELIATSYTVELDISKRTCKIYGPGLEISTIGGSSFITAVHKAVYEFAKWHNAKDLKTLKPQV